MASELSIKDIIDQYKLDISTVPRQETTTQTIERSKRITSNYLLILDSITSNTLGGTIYNEEPIRTSDSLREFTTSMNFKPKTTRLYRNGQRMKIGADNDYTELEANIVLFNYDIRSIDSFIIDYDINQSILT